MMDNFSQLAKETGVGSVALSIRNCDMRWVKALVDIVVGGTASAAGGEVVLDAGIDTGGRGGSGGDTATRRRNERAMRMKRRCVDRTFLG